MKNPGRWNALAGTVILVVWCFIFFVSKIDIALGLVFFVLVPLLVEEVVKHKEGNRAEQWLWKVMQTSLPFAGAGAISVTLPAGVEAGWWAAIWFFYTLLLAFGGLMRLLGRGVRPMEETIIDIGLMYIAVGGGWLLIAQAGWSDYLPYSETIVQLTAIHFHYAAFVLPLVTGFFGRYRSDGNRVRKRYMHRPYHVLAVGVIIGPILVAVGLDQGPPVEVITVGLYVLILIWLCIWWIWMSIDLSTWAGAGLRGASLVLLGTMVLSFLYSLGLMIDAYSITVHRMVSYHGLLNAFGFSVLAVLSWRRTGAPQRHRYTSFPVSRVRASGYIGNDAVYKNKWVESYRSESGLIPTWRFFQSDRFDPTTIHPLVRRFYLRTDQYDMHASIRWQRGFRRLSGMSHRLTKRFGQINLPPSSDVEMNGEIVAISDEQDGRRHVRAWIRKNRETDEPIFTALYSFHKQAEERYMNIGLPLPFGMMTGVLRLQKDDGDGLILSSHQRVDARGDEGVYVTLGSWTIRTPLREWFHVQADESGELIAKHFLSLLNIPFLTITYHIREKAVK
ncbi:YndJ family protein [Halobacillus locisalis]|uniref:YndJ family protein n=1 Tax=Halobacillus locisalis TaxID=220753 RepID=A0A838CXE9_9BACI|nr:YndJ family protein [Halobacillus locisalis]MBA2176717.1 YndJ family protein [Halobacillus locisalis]